jgi:hypothetical protein
MKIFCSSSKRGPILDASEALLLVLLAVSVIQIGSCFEAGRVLVRPTETVAASVRGVQVSANAPLVEDRHVVRALKSAAFPSGVNRG